jgi:hypothetical protein
MFPFCFHQNRNDQKFGFNECEKFHLRQQQELLDAILFGILRIHFSFVQLGIII